MRRAGIEPNELTYPFVLKACAHSSAFGLGKQIHCDCVKRGFHDVVFVQNALMLLYGSCGLVYEVCMVFDEMPLRTMVSWNTILTAHVDNSFHEEAIGLLRQMRSDLFEPNETTFVVLLSAAAVLGSLRFGKWVHGQIISWGIDLSVQLGTAVVNMYAKCGDLYFATRVFERMRARNVCTWNVMILGYAHYGSGKEALELFSQMKTSSIRPNYVTFLTVLSACSHSGLINEGFEFFDEMVNVHSIEPRMTHYCAMVDILGRKGLLLEAYEFINQIPIDPDAVVWRTLLSACQLHADKDVHGIVEMARRELLELEPKRSDNYVIIANMFSEVGSWDEAARVRKIMKDEGLKKVAGESCVEVGKSINRFVCGGDANDDCGFVYDLLDGLSLNMKTIGFKDVISLQHLEHRL
ncbi:pentatricopeptide repeat-containing protein At2g36730-like [Asparagus officinalis]|nr:pentatricopeptide repeat-containing protein At2g36730-like [Asparagus officinalis]